MGQNYDPFHVPQQNRRNKLRVNNMSEIQTQQQQSRFHNTMNNSDPLQQGLSLSLSFQLVENGQRYIHGNNNNGAAFSVPLGPFTGYASVLQNSKFLKPAQQIFDDLFGAVHCDFIPQPDPLMTHHFAFTDPLLQLKDSNFIFLLDQVYKKYKVYCQQMESVVASFETVAGLGNAAPYICNAIKSVSTHFRHLKNALVSQIQFTNGDGNDKCHPRNPPAGLSHLQHPVWRSQRGLPDHAVAILKTWLFDHFLHPYPSDSEKQILAQQTGLSRTQVSNWFINARVRLWKPMVEEVYKLSSQQPRATPLETNTQSTDNIIPPDDFYLRKQAGNLNNKRSRNELIGAHHHHLMYGQNRQEEQGRNLICSDNHQSSGFNGSNGVCLALGLHQNNSYVTPTTLPIPVSNHVNALQMYGFMDSDSAASFHSQCLDFGKDH